MSKFITTLGVLLLFLATPALAGVTFDGSPGTAAPPSTLGGYTMTAFGDDTRANGSNVSDAPGPNGDISFDPSLNHRSIGSGWATWSHGYTGDVYVTGGTSIEITMPANTLAFYFYAEPNVFSTFSMEATADDGTTSGPVSVNGFAGAKYFGFYADGGDKIVSITITAPSAAAGFAIGEFGIFQCEAPTISVSVSPSTLWPANHQMADIAATVSTTGSCTPLTVELVSVTSNEPDNGDDDGNTVNDIDGHATGTADYAFRVRKERSGSGSGRTYTATYRVTDASGSTATASATVNVPLNQGGNKPVLSMETWDGVELLQNTPNPVDLGTEISFRLSQSRPIALVVYDVRGAEVRTLASGEHAAGAHTILWDGRDANGDRVPAGQYIYRLEGTDCRCGVSRSMKVVR